MGWLLKRDAAVAGVDLLDPPVADTANPDLTVTIRIGFSGSPRDVLLAIRRVIVIAWSGAILVRRDGDAEWSLTTYGLISWRVAELVLTHRAALAVLELTLRGYDTDWTLSESDSGEDDGDEGDASGDDGSGDDSSGDDDSGDDGSGDDSGDTGGR